MEPIEDLAALKPVVEGLIERKLMVELTPPGRGQLVSHNLYLPDELVELRGQHGHGSGPHETSVEPRPGIRSTTDLLTLVGALRDQVTRLTQRVEKLESLLKQRE